MMNKQLELSDAEVISAVCAGDVHTFRIIVDRYKNKAMSLCVRLLKNRPAAEDALQDAFLRTFKSLKSFRQDSAFSTWFYRIVYNVCIQNLRTLQRESSTEVFDEESIDRINDWIPDLLQERQELARITDEEIQKLPTHFRAVLTLFYTDELSYEEICAVMNLPLGTVKTHLHRAKHLLRINIERHFEMTVHSHVQGESP